MNPPADAAQKGALTASAEASPVAAGEDDDRIFDRGYRAYTGPRRGLRGSVSSVIVHSIRASLGMGRPARHKILPGLAIVLSLLPAVAFVGLSVALDVPETFDTEGLISYHDYYNFITLPLMLFCGIVVPEILVSDRRSGMLALYLSTPLQRWSYLYAKTAAVALTLCIITIGPVLLLMLAHTVEGSGPDGLTGWTATLVRILLGGVAIAAPLAAASLAAASLTERRAIASVGVIGLLLGSSIVVGTLIEEAEQSVYLKGLDLGGIAYELVYRIYGQPGLYAELSTSFVMLFNAGWFALGAAVVWWRYRQLAVSR